MSLIDLTDRIALVTGGSRGIGAATVTMLAQAGCAVAFTYRTRREEAQRVQERAGERARAFQADLSNREQCERVVSETVAAFGGIDVLVANAGIWPPEDVSLTDMSDEQWSRTMATNLDSVFWSTRAALRAMLSRAAGATRAPGPGTRGPGSMSAPPASPATGRSIVIVSSTAGQRGEAFHADYAATKGALISFVKSVAVEVAPYDITVNAVAPGWVDTEMSARPYQREGGKGKREVERTIPLGRVATPEDIAGPILFLCSPLARHITGEILNVNGGSVLCG